MPEVGKEQAKCDNGDKSNHICVPASTPTPPANLNGRQRHPNAVPGNVLAGGKGESALLGLEISLVPHFIFSYAYSQFLGRKEMGGMGGWREVGEGRCGVCGGKKIKKSPGINLISEGILVLYIYSTAAWKRDVAEA